MAKSATKTRLLDLTSSPPLSSFIPGRHFTVSDQMQTNYTYTLSRSPGKNFSPHFTPALTPEQMLSYGVFEGKYLNDCTSEFPREWFLSALKKNRLSPHHPDPQKNYFKIKSRQPLQVWLQKGWILPDDPDPRGWFQWYCRYYLGRREPTQDTRQIKRWRNFARHFAQVRKNCQPQDLTCRPRQRQALLQWAYNPFI